MVSEQVQAGKRLIDALVAQGVAVRVAFWVKPTEEDKEFLYFASPTAEEKGHAAVYRIVHNLIREMPDLWIDPFAIRVIAMNDTMTKAALEATQSRMPNNPFAMQNAKPYPGMTRFYGTTFGGVSVDSVSIYPPFQEAAA